MFRKQQRPLSPAEADHAYGAFLALRTVVIAYLRNGGERDVIRNHLRFLAKNVDDYLPD